MSESTLNILEKRFQEKTGLEKNQFMFARQAGAEYIDVVVVQDGGLKTLGMFSHQGYVRNGFNTVADQASAEKFIDLCADKLKDDTVEVPPLVALRDYLNPVYK